MCFLKKSFLLLLVVATIFAATGNAGRVKLANGETVCVCTMDYNPVCDTNGADYSNLCSFECARDEAVALGRSAITLRENGGRCVG